MRKRFAADISRICRKAGDDMDAVARMTCQDLGFIVVEGTPLDTGFARASWQPSLNTPQVAAGPGDAMGQVALVTAQMKAGDKFFMLNNAAYILRLEYGWSQQAPNGMVRITLARAQQIARDNIRLIRSGKK